MDRRTKICIQVILIGLANFFAYSIIYMFIGGEAVSGHTELCCCGGPDGAVRYFLQSGREVPGWVFVYSGVHSISIWITVAAVMLAMLTLAKERIVSSMRSAVVRGRTFITILATVITFMAVAATIWFTLQFIHKLSAPVTIPRPPAESSAFSSSGVSPKAWL